MNEKLILAVTGSVAAYKAPFILRLLRERGFRTPVVVTEAALKFVGRATFESLSTEGVYDDLWARRDALNHISLLEDAKLVIVTPATANTIAKTACGIADNLLSSLLLAADPRALLFAPAMNSGMWNNPATQENIQTLKSRGVSFVEPGTGELACGVRGKGRLAELDEIVLACERIVRANPQLSGKKVVVTAGRTQEQIDPVRVITNRSSGRMGREIALAFARAGARVTLVAAETCVPPPPGIETLRALSASLMLQTLKKLMPETDVLVMAAAVADYSPVELSSAKIKQEKLTLSLAKTPDILSSLNEYDAIKIGFSVETGDDWHQTAKKKLETKGLDAIVANPASVISSEETEAKIIYSSGETLDFPRASKAELAERIVSIAGEIIQARRTNA